MIETNNDPTRVLHVDRNGDFYYPGYSDDGTLVHYLLTRRQAIELGTEQGVVYDTHHPDTIPLSSVFPRKVGSRLMIADGKKSLDDWFCENASVLPACLVYFPRSVLVRTDIFARWCAEAKVSDPAHAGDYNKEYKRQRDGKLAEVAVEMLYRIAFIDWTIRSNSVASNYPDLLPAGLRIGVKSAMWPNAPLVSIRNHEPEIFVLISPDYTHAVVMGYAPAQLLAEQTESGIGDAYVLCDSVRNGKKDPKTGFVAFDELKRARDLDTLCMFVSSNDPNLITTPYSDAQMRTLENNELEQAVYEAGGGNFWNMPDDWYKAKIPDEMQQYDGIIASYQDDDLENTPWWA